MDKNKDLIAFRNNDLNGNYDSKINPENWCDFFSGQGTIISLNVSKGMIFEGHRMVDLSVAFENCKVLNLNLKGAIQKEKYDNGKMQSNMLFLMIPTDYNIQIEALRSASYKINKIHAELGI